ncbi:hypothetical protein [Alkalispirochaeta alkalica]|uniref:hypothetical protein n=1 Tax=Alkalispirochaeta alkalica TaxID=46356 RepID=UPI000399F0B0|nr:hypothetical protein [Alkalispirochaeta alkalica]
MSNIIYTPKIEFRGFEVVNELQFYDQYSSIFDYSVNLDQPKQKSKIENREKICSFCSKSESDGARFSDDCHVIPAFFNDPKLLSDEECVDCNHKFGEKYESDLSKMLNPFLINSQILRRKGITRTAKNSNTRFEFNKEQGVDVKTSKDFDVDTEEGNLKISIPREAFNPQNALRSLLHTFWLVIDINERKKYPWIISALKNQDLRIPSAIYLGFNAGGTRSIDLKVFKLKKRNEQLCEYILKLSFGLYFIYYGIYENDFKPILIEPISIDSSITIPPEVQMTDFKSIKSISAGEHDLSFSFEEYSKDGQAIRSSVSRKEIILVSLYINGSEIINKTKVTFFYNGKVHIHGHDLAAKIIITENANDNKFELDPYGNSILNLKKTLDFIREINTSDSFEIRPMKGGQNLKLPTFQIPINQYYINTINALYDISTHVGKNMIFTPSNEEEEIKNALWFAEILNMGIAIGNFIKITVDTEDKLKSLLNDLHGKDNFYFDFQNEEIRIMNIKINLSEYVEVHCVNIKKIIEEGYSVIIEGEKIVLCSK